MDKRILLFLAIDGVLGPQGSGATPHLGRLIQILETYPVDLVIIDPMRSTKTVDEIKAMFPEVVASRIVGATRDFDHERKLKGITKRPFSGNKRMRWDCDGDQEVMSFGHSIAGWPSYVVVDWDRSRYGQDVFIRHHVVFTDSDVGMDRVSEIRLRSLLTHAVNPGVVCRKRLSSSHQSVIGDSWEKSSWVPKVAMIIPVTTRLEAAVQSGVLTRRLFRGLDRIYISEMALVRRPKLSEEIATLRQQFPERLSVVAFDDFHGRLFGIYVDDFGYTEAEQFIVAGGLTNAYRADLKDHDMPEVEIMFSLGEPLKKTISYGWPIALEDWDRLDEEGIRRIAGERKEYWAHKDEETIEALDATLDAARERGSQ